MIFALIPAAGKSTRMGRPKLALKLGDRTVLEHAIVALRSGGADTVLVVLAPQTDDADLRCLAEKASAQTFVLPAETPDMRATIQAGLDWLERHCAPQPTDAWLLAPADHPTMDPQLIRRLIEARQGLPADAIVVPTWQDRRGHPTLIGWPHAAALRGFPPKQGVNAYLRQCQSTTHEIEAPSSTVLQDMDTPEDYERLTKPRTK